MSLAEHRPQWLTLQNPALELANAIAGTDFVPAGLRNNPAAITAAILYGDEIGLGPMQSLSRIAVINGRPSLAAETQRALILAAGHDLWIEDSTITRCTVAGRRRDSDNTSRVTWTIDDAKRAGLGGKQSWRAYPRQMLLARASAELARAVFADVIGGLAASEEFEGDEQPLEPAGNGPAPVPAPARRRRASVSQPATTGDQPPPAEPEPPPLPGEEEPAEPPVTEAQMRRLQQLFREQGFTEREHRLAFASAILHHRIESSKDLTEDEVRRLINALETRA